MIGIMGAMSEEIALLQANMQVTSRRTIGQREFLQGQVYGLETVLVFSRYGKVSAAITSALLIAHYPIDALIFVGVAGSADPSSRVGDVVIADELIQHDMNCTPLFPRYQIPLLGVATFKTTTSLVTLTKQAADAYLSNRFQQDIGAQAMSFGITTPHCKVGAVASGDQFIKDIAYARRIKDDTQPLLSSILLAFEMEGAAVAQACFELGKPFIVIRTISDNADHGAPVDFSSFIHTVARHYSNGIIKELYKSLIETQWLTENSRAKIVL